MIRRKILLDQPITVGAREAENVVGILLEQREVVVQCRREVLLDGVRVFSRPLRIEMRVKNCIERGSGLDIIAGRRQGTEDEYGHPPESCHTPASTHRYCG